MKHSKITKTVGAGLLGLSLTVLASTMPASAQSNTGGTDSTAPTTTTDTTQTQGTDAVVREDRGFDWGWLGLLGLAGLAGLARKREEPARYRDPDPVGGTGTTYRE